MGAFLGHAQTQTSTIVLTLPSQGTMLDVSDVEYRGESFRSPRYYALRLTWSPDAHQWLGIETEYIHAKVFAELDRLSLWRGFGALGEYKFTWASPELEVAGGQAKVPARSHHFVFGLKYGF